MSIELHCTQCQKLIKAPDEAGGRRGKCPYCGNSMYIPTPIKDDDILDIAPVDESEERRAEEERRAALRYASDVAHEAAEPADEGDAGAAVAGATDDVDDQIAAYVSAMGASRLDDAQAAVAALKRIKGAKKAVKAADPEDLAARIGDIPPPVVKGFLKTLQGEV